MAEIVRDAPARTAEDAAAARPVAERIQIFLESVFSALSIVFLATAFPLVVRAEDRIETRFVFRVLLPVFAAGVGPAVLMLVRWKWPFRFRLRMRYAAVPMAAILILSLWRGLRLHGPYANVLFLLLVPGSMVFLWAWLYRSPNGLLAYLPLQVAGVALFASELPAAFVESSAVHHWATDATFAYFFPTSPPFMGPGGRLKPSTRCRIWAPDYPLGAWFSTNSAGFRNTEEFESEPGSGEIRILSLGDSFSAGFAADQEAFLGPLVEKALRRKRSSPTIRVMNAEVCDLARAAYYMEHYGKRYKPKLVLYGLCGNDIEQSVAYCGADKVFRVTAEDRVEPNPAFNPDAPHPTTRYSATAYPIARTTTGPLPVGPVAPPEPQRPEIYFRSRLVRHGVRLTESLTDFLVFRNIAVARAERQPAVVYTGAATYEEADGRKRLIDGNANLGFYYVKTCPAVEEMYADFLPILAAMDKTAQRAGARFVLVFFPQRYQVQPRDWQALCRFWNLREEDFDLDLCNRTLADFCRRNSILFCDLTEAFRAAARSRPLFLPQGDMHFNIAGNRLAAATVARFLQSRNLP